MSVGYKPVLWNKYKKRYDIFLWLGIILYLIAFFIINRLLFPQLIAPTIIIRSFGTLGIILLQIILLIGPLCRINKKFLPLLYNRRHLGVTMFSIASVHAIMSLLWFHSGGNAHPLVSLFASNIHYDSFRFFPFQTLGFAAYIILMIMAFTSHDFWLNFFSPHVWKAMHMLVYLAYSLIIMHVALGIIQLENSPILFSMLMIGLLAVGSLHIIAGYKEWKFDNASQTFLNNEWIYVCATNEIVESFAKMAIVNKERVAIFKYDNKLSAVHNVCKHQNGPLGEGKIVDGCITCPWHGYQYQPHDGCAPSPFHEKLATYQLKLVGNKIYVNTNALPEGTAVAPLILTEENKTEKKTTPFFIGWSSANPNVMLQFVKKTGIGFICLALFIAICFSFSQKHIANSSFDYDHPQKLRGELVEKPFPALRTVTGKDIYGNPVIKTYPLVNDAKFGADGVVHQLLRENHDNNPTAIITGGLIKRDSSEAIELSNGKASVEMMNAENELPKSELIKISDTVITGEIIDPKCYLGAMNPGEGKPHRSCAILCISGGIMPMLTFKNKERKPYYAVLVGTNGERINKQVLDYVAQPVSIKGKLYTFDNWFVFYINPANAIVPLQQ